MTQRFKHYTHHGFALPTVLIASVVMLAVLATSVAAASATRSALVGQYYNQIARDAANSGLEMAKSCIAAGYSTWANPLRPGGDCAGLAAQCASASCYIVQSSDIRSSFAVSAPAIAGNINTVSVSGTLEQTRSSTGTVWRSYAQAVRVQQNTTPGVAPSTNMVWAQIAAGDFHSCAISGDGRAYCWGYNTSGQLGNNSTTSSSTPVAVTIGGTSAIPAGSTIKQISAGNSHTCAIASDNKVYCWGSNSNGQLGNNSTTSSSVPVAVTTGGTSALPSTVTIKQVSAGGVHTCVLASDNKVYCWGYNTYGQLGNNSTTQSLQAVAVTTGTLPTVTRQIAAGYFQTCAIGSDNKAYCWGSNTYNELGNASGTNSPVPVAVSAGAMGTATVKQIAAHYTTCAIASDNKMYCWGRGTNGELGNNTSANSSTPVAVTQGGSSAIPSTATIRQISVGSDHTCAIASDNKTYCWGLNTNGQLGNNSTTQSLLAVAVSQTNLPSGGSFRQIVANVGYHTCALASDNKTYCWGRNDFGQVDSSATNRLIPTATTAVSTVNNMLTQQVSAHANTSCAIASDSKAYCWGANGSGQLGNGNTTQGGIPVAVSQGATPATATMLQIDTATLHTCAVASDNNAYCWGDNTNGELGTGNNTNSTTPAAVVAGGMPSTNVIQVTAGNDNHSCAIASDNKAYCWGNNASGQVGNNTLVSTNSPVAVTTTNLPAGAMIRQMSAGNGHTCAIASDNKAYCWGLNSSGQLGNNSTTNSPIPVAVSTTGLPAGAMLIQIVAGDSHTCAIASDSKVYCWGNGSNGKLGNNGTSNSLVPVAVTTTNLPSGAMVVQLTAGANHTCAIASDTKAYCWGLNGNGQIGNNGTTNSLIPTAVSTGATPSGVMNQLTAGGTHSCAIASDLKTYCWGNNGNSQIGDNTTTQRLTATATNPFIIYPPTVLSTYFF